MPAYKSRGSKGKGIAAIIADKENSKGQLSSLPGRPTPEKTKKGSKTGSKKQTPKKEDEVGLHKSTIATKETSRLSNSKAEVEDERDQTTNTGRKRKRTGSVQKVELEHDELPHNMGKRRAATAKVKEEGLGDAEPSPMKVNTSLKKAEKEDEVDDAKVVIKGAKAAKEVEEPAKKKAKIATQYGLTTGKSPFPDWPHPSAEEAQIVHDLLLTEIPAERRPNFVQPDTIPPPSEQVAGCGEVPSILDALIRTLLSAATTGRNSSNAFQGLVKRFGLETKGLGKGSVDWNAVRLAPQKEVFQAIESGGLADSKSKNIKTILEMVYLDNEERRNALLKAKKAGEDFTVEQEAELLLLQQGVLTLDYYHVLSTEDALNTFIKYPGIGIKTASCVALFCMQRPSFAVDTHVFRLCQYLNWVPPENLIGPRQKKPDRNTTFSHCEVMIPDRLKYGLHQLFLNHGKNCPRCRAATGERSTGWAEANCVIEHLVKRLGAKKGGLDSLKRVSKVKKGKNSVEDKAEDEDVEMDDAGGEGLPAVEKESKANPKKKPRVPTTAKKNTTGATPKTSSKVIKTSKASKASETKTTKPATKARDDEDTDTSSLTDAPESESS